MLELTLTVPAAVGTTEEAYLTIDALDENFNEFTVMEVQFKDAASEYKFQEVKLLPYQRAPLLAYAVSKKATIIWVNHAKNEKGTFAEEEKEGVSLRITQSINELLPFLEVRNNIDETITLQNIDFGGVESLEFYVKATLFEELAKTVVHREAFISPLNPIDDNFLQRFIIILDELSYKLAPPDPVALELNGDWVDFTLEANVAPPVEFVQINMQLRVGGPVAVIFNDFSTSTIEIQAIIVKRAFDDSEFLNIAPSIPQPIPPANDYSFAGSLPPDPTNDYKVSVLLVEDGIQYSVTDEEVNMPFDADKIAIVLIPTAP